MIHTERFVVRKVSAAEAKAHLSALVAEVAYGGQHVVIERRGKAIAALVSIEDLDRLEHERARSARPQGALALVGAWRDIPDRKLDALLSDIYAARQRDTGRPVNLEA
ncbi:MAG: type II toxin-antitoxin system Phd/YefM family antitoxin [Chloroflexi bacterium]|nr:type II toxin-antitoxin system Phd/YefM family antitoxin [Chloroflexota bacterium]